MVVRRRGQADVLRAFHGPERRVLRGALRAEEGGGKRVGLARGLQAEAAARGQQGRLVAVPAAGSVRRDLPGGEGAAGGRVLLLDGRPQEGRRLLLGGALAPLLLLQLQPQLLHVPLLLLQLPGELVDHLLLLHQHLVLLGVQPVQLGRDAAAAAQAAHQAVVGAQAPGGRVQPEGGRRVVEGVRQGPGQRQVGRGGRDGGAGAGAAEVVEAVGQGAGGRGGLVMGQGAGGRDGKGDGGDVPEAGHGAPRAVLEGPQPVHERRLGA